MKKFKERMAEKAGFTLVELIVVIAILGILAAVAVPTYSGYVKKAQDAADLQVLSAVNTAAQATAASKQATVTKVEVKASSGTISEISVTATKTAANDTTFAYTTDSTFKLLLGEKFLAENKLKGSFVGGANWAINDTTGDGEWTPTTTNPDEEGGTGGDETT